MARIEAFTRDLSESQFLADQRTISAVLYELFVIGEASAHLPTSLKEKHPSIPWPQIKAMRNVLAHAYFGVRMNDVWNTLQRDLPGLHKQLQEIQRQS